jgi:hypothetical protein
MSSDRTRVHVLTSDDKCPCGKPQEGSGFCSYECYSKYEMGAPIEPAPSIPVPAAQPGAGATDTAGTETDRGTGERGTHGRSEVVSIEHGRQIAMTAMDLAEARWRHEHGQPHRREHCEACAREAVAEAARPVHYREAAKSIRAMADADEAAEPPIGCEINYLRGLRRAADLLDSTAHDLEDGE